MYESLIEAMKTIALAVDAAGVLIIVGGAVFALLRLAFRRTGATDKPYRMFREDMGRGILLGLEFLIAGDIIRTVGVSPTVTNVSVLGLVVLIRTFLSMTLRLEVEGRWPWQEGKEAVSVPSVGFGGHGVP